MTLAGAAGQAVGGSFGTTFNGLTIADPAGVTLGAAATVNGLLTFTSGVVTTGPNTIALGATGSVSRTSGHVAGSFRKPVATGAPTRTYEVGDATAYTPVTLAFAGVTVAGTVTVSATPGDHPQLDTSTLDTAMMAHRWWTVGRLRDRLRDLRRHLHVRADGRRRRARPPPTSWPSPTRRAPGPRASPAPGRRPARRPPGSRASPTSRSGSWPAAPSTTSS